MPKTTQALKVTASWTPHASVAQAILAGVFPATGFKMTSGRLSLAHAVQADFTDPAHATRVAERIAQIKAELAEKGTIHSFTTTAGRVPIEEAEVLGAVIVGDGTGDALPPISNEERTADPVAETRARRARADADKAVQKAAQAEDDGA